MPECTKAFQNLLANFVTETDELRSSCQYMLLLRNHVQHIQGTGLCGTFLKQSDCSRKFIRFVLPTREFGCPSIWAV